MLPPAIGPVTLGLLAAHYVSLAVLIASGMAWLGRGVGLPMSAPGTGMSALLLVSVGWQLLAALAAAAPYDRAAPSARAPSPR